MKLLQETIDKESSLPNQQEKTTALEKQSVVSQKQSVVYTSLQILKLNLKRSRIERMHTDIKTDLSFALRNNDGFKNKMFFNWLNCFSIG